jgi:sarcosine oxidase subunit beta
MKERVSVAIIGGGIIGSSIAYNLAAKGIHEVAVLDKGKAGAGSTAASLGGFRHQFSSQLSIELSKRSVKILEEFRDLTRYDPLIKRDGYVFVASTNSSMTQLKKDRELQAKLGVPVELVSKEGLQERYPFYKFDGILGGNFCGMDGHASTMAVLQGYLTAAKRLGVEVYENTEVTSIERMRPGLFILGTSKGRLASDSLVIAAGAYSGLVGKLAAVDIPIEPYPRKVLLTRSFSDGIPGNVPLIVDIDSTFAFGREGKGLLMATNQKGASTFDLVFPPDYEENVMRTAFERVPATKRASLSNSNAGLYEMTPDSNPIVCEMPGIEGLYCCSGFAGHGFMHAPAVGEVMAELITRGRTSIDISSYGMDRFTGAPTNKEGLII